MNDEKQRPGACFVQAQDELNAHFAHIRRHFFASRGPSDEKPTLYGLIVVCLFRTIKTTKISFYNDAFRIQARDICVIKFYISQNFCWLTANILIWRCCYHMHMLHITLYFHQEETDTIQNFMYNNPQEILVAIWPWISTFSNTLL